MNIKLVSVTAVIALSLVAGAVAGGGLDVGGRADVRSGRSSDHKYVNDLTLRNRCVQYCPTHSEAVGARDRFERRSKRALPLSAPRRIVQALTGTAPALRQRMHQFDGALADLATVLNSNPRNVQARLTRAAVLQVQGAYGAVREGCRALKT